MLFELKVINKTLPLGSLIFVNLDILAFTNENLQKAIQNLIDASFEEIYSIWGWWFISWKKPMIVGFELRTSLFGLDNSTHK